MPLLLSLRDNREVGRTHMTNIVEKKKVTEVREVEVEKVVLTLDLDQAAFLAAILLNTTYSSLELVPGMTEVESVLTNYDTGIPFDKFYVRTVTVERSPYYNEDAT